MDKLLCRDKKRANLKSVFIILENLIGYADNTPLRSNVIRDESSS